MDKTININLGGVLFQIDEEAFRILRDYLDAIKNHFGNSSDGHETVEDIESRIAEIFQSQKGNAGVISKENVESMIAMIGKPEDFDQTGRQASGPSYPHTKKKLLRNPDDVILGGVCSGIAAYMNMEPVLFRVLFVIFTFFFGIGILVYLALWIVLPKATTESQRRSLYGDSYALVSASGYPQQSHSAVGSALNEIFRALGKIFFVVLRIFLIIIGIAFIATGFLSIFSYIMVFLFPGIRSFGADGLNLVNVPEFLRYVVNPSAVPWIMILATISFILPMLALIYWGVKMIFWFKARDGVVSLIAFLVWIAAIAALSVIGFNEGISFAQTSKSFAESVLPNNPDTLYISSKNRIDNLKYESMVSIPHEDYAVYINNERKELYIRTFVNIDRSYDNKTRIEVRKRSTGRTHPEAQDKAESLVYNYTMSGDTLKADEYFTLPAGRKWSADDVSIRLYIPEGMIVKFDESAMRIQSWHNDDFENRLYSRWETSSGCWKMTSDGLEYIEKN